MAYVSKQSDQAIQNVDREDKLLGWSVLHFLRQEFSWYVSNKMKRKKQSYRCQAHINCYVHQLKFKLFSVSSVIKAYFASNTDEFYLKWKRFKGWSKVSIELLYFISKNIEVAAASEDS